MSLPRLLVSALVPASLLVAACSASDPAPSEPASSIPEAWLEKAAEGWPESSGFGASAPVLSWGSCLLTDKVYARDAVAKEDLSGWGPYGDDAQATGAYRYVCEFRGEELSARIQVIQAASAADAERTVEIFHEQSTNADQENSPTTVQVGGVDVHVNHRIYPRSSTGEVESLFLDEGRNALVSLEIRSLDEAEVEAYPAQQAAEDLMLQLARG